MQIHFTHQFPWGDPTHFVQKVWKSLVNSKNHRGDINSYYFSLPHDKLTQINWFNHVEKGMDKWFELTPKPHTIREDKTDRWKAGMNIHFVVWTDKSYRSTTFQFAPLMPCVSVQKIEIKYEHVEWMGELPFVYVDGKKLNHEQSVKFAKNDGFNSLEDFFKWFYKDFTGKIIHWTKLKY